ncbi:ABC transporter substrate-binding protein [Suttonella ornithocola]|uniref:Sulfate starvation-induced protein 1 n=1 Tax=Suttonella ornithocola TaxID=279832 RepID=A0A380MP56_9GAMM|nr:ABC transporter substrate-binding protein [Suttonella ornithocola]SUO94102.1 Sulfate starvation-induced protein 1 [Suttonella ornithocola]
MKKLWTLLFATIAIPSFAAEPIKVGYISFTAHSPNFIAKERGYFEKQGLDAELVRFQSAQQMAVAIASGDLDYGVTAITGGLLNLAARGDAIRIFGGALQEADDVPGQVIIASNAAYEKGLKTPKDLSGKRWAVTTAGSSFSYMGSKIAKAAGVEPKSLQMVPLNAVPTIISALSTGQVDAWAIQPNIANRLIAEGKVKGIGKVAEYLPNYQVTVLFTSTKNVQEHPEQVNAFKKAFAQGIADYNAALVDKTADKKETQAVIDMVHKYVYSDEAPEKAAKLIASDDMRLSPGAALNTKDALKQIDWFKAQKIIPANLEGATIITPDAGEAAK